MEGALAVIALLLAIVALSVAIATLVIVMRAKRLSPSDPLRGARQAELERRFAQLGHRLEVLESDFDARPEPEVAQGRPTASMARRPGASGAHIGLVRFDAFDDAGGGQSFALALIDDEGDGVVLSSLHSRQASRLYVKDIRGGVADAPLSSEEERALKQAGLDI
jgi:hypothetical protein